MPVLQIFLDAASITIDRINLRRIKAVAAVEQEIGHAIAREKRVVAVFAEERIGATRAGWLAVSGPAVEAAVAAVADEGVVACVAEDRVIHVAAGDLVGEVAAFDHFD